MAGTEQKKIDLSKCLMVPLSLIQDCGPAAAMHLASYISDGEPIPTDDALFIVLKTAGYVDEQGNWECSTCSATSVENLSPLALSHNTVEWRVECYAFEKRLEARGFPPFSESLEDVPYKLALQAIMKSNKMGWVTLNLSNEQRTTGQIPIQTFGNNKKVSTVSDRERGKFINRATS